WRSGISLLTSRQVASDPTAAHAPIAGDFGIGLKGVGFRLGQTDGAWRVKRVHTHRDHCRHAQTDQGLIVGTMSYMSPEQAEGKSVDARSDVFSFGTLLYEMLTGRRAFHGDSKMSTLAAILNREPEPIEKIAPEIPREVSRIVQ